MTPTDILPNLSLQSNNLVIPLSDLALPPLFSGGDLVYALVRRLSAVGLFSRSIPQGIAEDTVRLRYNGSFDVIIATIGMVAEPPVSPPFITLFGNNLPLTDNLQLTN